MIKTLGIEFEFEVRSNFREDQEDEIQCGHSGDGSEEPCERCVGEWFCGYGDCPPANYNTYYQSAGDRYTTDGPPIGDQECPWAVTRPWDSGQRRFCSCCRHGHNSACADRPENPMYPQRSRYDSRQFLDDSLSVTPLPADWEIKHDGSLNSGFEICTPILELSKWPMDNVYKLFDRVLSGMRSWGCRAHRTCGVHVHVGYPETKPFERSKLQRRLLGTACNNEDILYQLAAGEAANHRGRSYCNPISEEQATQVWYTKPGFARFNSDKYYGINLSSRHGTVEFRYFNGTTQPSVAMSYVHLALGMMNHAARSTSIMRPCLTAHEFISRLGIPKGDWWYFDSFFDLKEDKHKCKLERQKYILRPGPTGIRTMEKGTKEDAVFHPLTPSEFDARVLSSLTIAPSPWEQPPMHGSVAPPPPRSYTIIGGGPERPRDERIEEYIRTHTENISGRGQDNRCPCECSRCTEARQYQQERSICVE